jgi:hypothetical protein
MTHSFLCGVAWRGVAWLGLVFTQLGMFVLFASFTVVKVISMVVTILSVMLRIKQQPTDDISSGFDVMEMSVADFKFASLVRIFPPSSAFLYIFFLRQTWIAPNLTTHAGAVLLGKQGVLHVVAHCCWNVCLSNHQGCLYGGHLVGALDRAPTIGTWFFSTIS